MNTPILKMPESYYVLKREQEQEQQNALKNLIYLAQELNSAQIIIDSFTNHFSSFYSFMKTTTQEALIENAKKYYKEHIELINRLPKDVAEAFICEYSTFEARQNEVLNYYSYYKGYNEIFYLLHTISNVFIIYNGNSLKKDDNKYISDFSWGYVDLSGDDSFPDDKRVSGNAIQTAEVILSAVFPNDDEKLNLITPFIDTFLIENTSYHTNSSFSKKDVLNWYDNFNIIRRVCIEQKITYRDFGERIGFGEGAIKNAAASGKISDQLKKAIEMYLEIQRLTKENKKFKKLQELIKEITYL